MYLSLFDFNEIKIALASFEKHEGYARLADDLYGNYRQELGQIDVLIVRPPVEIPINDVVTEKRQAQRLLERFPYMKIYLLFSYDFLWHLSDNLHFDQVSDAFPFNKEDFFEACRQKELEEFVTKSPAIFRSPANSVFRTPSQEYTDAFLRVGNIQNRRHVLDVIFFWLLPFLKEAGALLTDSWSISSISLNVGRLYSRYMHSMGNDDGNHNFHVNFLTVFYHGKRKMERETREVLSPLLYANDKKILFLISAVKTKKSLQILKAEMQQQGFLEKLNFVALYALLPHLDISALCRLYGDYFKQLAGLPNGFQSSDIPPTDKTVVVIDELTFIPTNPQVFEIELKKDLAPESAEFFNQYLGAGAISVHRDAIFSNGTVQRHHGIFIDVSMLLKNDIFIKKLEKKIDEFHVAPSLIIYPPHPQGERFVQKISDILFYKFGVRVPAECFADLNTVASLTQEKIRKQILSLKESDLLLIIDDVLTTGNRLKLYQKMLRELPYKGQITYLIGVARTQESKDFQFLERDLTYRAVQPKHELKYIEKVFLPDWDKESCPWCQEAKLIGRALDENDFKDNDIVYRLTKRQGVLTSNSNKGLTNDAFLSMSDSPKASFSGGSIFSKDAGISEAELIVRIGATIHHLKTEGRSKGQNILKLGIEYPLYTIIRSKDYLGDTFNEALIKAAILRCSTAKELYAIEDKELQKQKKMINELINDGKLSASEKCFFYYELFLALQGFKLPVPVMANGWEELFKQLQQQYKRKKSSKTRKNKL